MPSAKPIRMGDRNSARATRRRGSARNETEGDKANDACDALAAARRGVQAEKTHASRCAYAQGVFGTRGSARHRGGFAAMKPPCFSPVSTYKLRRTNLLHQPSGRRPRTAVNRAYAPAAASAYEDEREVNINQVRVVCKSLNLHSFIRSARGGCEREWVATPPPRSKAGRRSLAGPTWLPLEKWGGFSAFASPPRRIAAAAAVVRA